MRGLLFELGAVGAEMKGRREGEKEKEEEKRRESGTVVYSQFLESYKSVTIDAMARAFGVSVDFIDHELSRFIAAGRLHCKIDKVAGVLETNRPDAKNALYQATIKQHQDSKVVTSDRFVKWVVKSSLADHDYRMKGLGSLSVVELLMLHWK
ncbi:hypothetical protein Droror1_Dr00025176 [Drosera rotundifolia]